MNHKLFIVSVLAAAIATIGVGFIPPTNSSGSILDFIVGGFCLGIAFTCMISGPKPK